MKTVILLFSAIVGIIAFTDKNKNISGTWVLQGGNLSANSIFRINMGEGVWQGKMDVPDQEVYDREIHSIKVDGDSVFITIFKHGSTIRAKMMNEKLMNGQLQLDSSVDDVELVKQ